MFPKRTVLAEDRITLWQWHPRDALTSGVDVGITRAEQVGLAARRRE